MRVGDQEILIPTSMVGNYPNPRWWDAGPVRDWTGDQEPPDAFIQEAFQDAMSAVVSDQEMAGLDIITDGRLQADSYGDQVLYYYFRRLGYDLKGATSASRSTVACTPPPSPRRSSGMARSWWSRLAR